MELYNGESSSGPTQGSAKSTEETCLEQGPSKPFVSQDGEDDNDQDTENSGIADNADEQVKPTKTKFTVYQKITFVSAVLAVFVNTLAMSIIAVFYPVEAESRGMSQTVIGLVFSSFSFAVGIGSPVWGKIIPTVGARFVFLAGAFVSGSCNIMFGFLIYMPTEATFTGFSFVIRLLEGLGTSACWTASSTIVAFAFPDNIGTALSMVEMASGLSLAIGPAIGGLLYNAGGFKLPFFVLGGLVLAIDAVNFFLMPKQGNKDEKPGSLRQVLKIPAICVTLLAVIVASLAISSIDPTLSIHLDQLNFTVIQTSLVFFSLGFAYMIFSVVWGAVADAKKTTRTLITCGLLGTVVFFLLLGPCPLLKIHPSKWLAGLVVPFGASMIAMVAMPTFVDMFTSAEWHGIPDGLGLTALISGLWNGGFGIGVTIGPVIGSSLTESFGFAWMSSVVAGCCLLVLVVFLPFAIWEYRCGKGRRVPRSRVGLEASGEAESSQLLPNEA